MAKSEEKQRFTAESSFCIQGFALLPCKLELPGLRNSALNDLQSVARQSKLFIPLSLGQA